MPTASVAFSVFYLLTLFFPSVSSPLAVLSPPVFIFFTPSPFLLPSPWGHLLSVLLSYLLLLHPLPSLAWPPPFYFLSGFEKYLPFWVLYSLRSSFAICSSKNITGYNAGKLEGTESYIITCNDGRTCIYNMDEEERKIVLMASSATEASLWSYTFGKRSHCLEWWISIVSSLEVTGMSWRTRLGKFSVESCCS